MKSHVEELSKLERRLNIEVPSETVKTAFNKIYRVIQKDADISGFRKGKAPLNKIRQSYGDKVKQDVLQDIVQTNYGEALTEHTLEPIGNPQFDFKDINESSSFSFSALFEVRPKVTLKTSEGLSIKKEILKLDDSQVDQTLENIRKSKATAVDIFEDRPAQMGDIAIIDFDGSINGAPLEGGSGKDHSLELGSKNFIEGFEEKVVGMKVGSEKNISTKFPDDYHAKEISGKPVEFKVKLNKLQKSELPELNDELIKSLGGKDQTLQDLKKTIHRDLLKNEENRIKEDLKNNVLKKLVQENPMDVPKSLQTEQKQNLINDVQKRMTEQGMNEKDFIEYSQKWGQDFDNMAKEMVHSGFMIDAVAKEKKISCEDSDFEQKYTEMAQQTGLDLSKIKEFYGSDEQRSRLTYQIIEEKVVNYLIEHAKIEEVSKEQM